MTPKPVYEYFAASSILAQIWNQPRCVSIGEETADCGPSIPVIKNTKAAIEVDNILDELCWVKKKPVPKGHIPDGAIRLAFLTGDIWRNGGGMSGY